MRVARVVLLVVLALTIGNLHHYASIAEAPTDARVLSALEIVVAGALIFVFLRRRQADKAAKDETLPNT
jgi:hypothetical protein